MWLFAIQQEIMLNCAVVMGRLVADPEVRQTPSGVSVCRFTVAVDRSYVKQGEQRQADFIDIVAWRQTADFVCKYFKKGSMIAVQGNIQTRMYEDKDGNKRKSTEVLVSNATFCGSKNENSNNNVNVSPAVPDINADFEPLPDDDLPF